MDNRIFNVNGKGEDMLLAALQLVFKQNADNTSCIAWRQSKKHGLILFWTIPENTKGVTALPADVSPKEILPLVLAWLDSDKDEDHDGSNSKGWRVYCEDWGHVDEDCYAICAIKPVFLWHGK